ARGRPQHFGDLGQRQGHVAEEQPVSDGCRADRSRGGDGHRGECRVTERPVMLVTGSRKGIGRYFVEYYLAKGYMVEGCSRGEIDLKDLGYRHHHVDVADEKAVRGMIADISKRHGRIDVVLNNAAIASMNHILLTPAASANRMLQVNVTGTMLVCRDAAKVM